MLPRQGFDHVRGLAGQSSGDGFGGASGVVAAGKAHYQGVAAGALNQGGHRGPVGPAHDQIALPVPGL